MAINISFYVNESLSETQGKIDEFINNNLSDIKGYYIFHNTETLYDEANITEIKDISQQYYQETIFLRAKEYGFLTARCWFVVEVKDKEFQGFSVAELVGKLKETFGENNLLVLFEGDTIL